MSVLSRLVAPQDPHALSAGPDKPKFTRRPRTSDLRTSFRLVCFEADDLIVEEVRHGLTHDTAGGLAVAEVVATVGDTQFRGYVRPGGDLLLPEILRAHGLEARLTALLAAAGRAAR